MADSTCSFEGCERGVYAKGMCQKCYCRVWYQKRHPKKTTEDRFWAKVDKCGPNGCWVWTASKNGNGYGTFYWNGGPGGAHRYSYWLATGESPETVDHICHTTLCIKPDHLRAATRKQNNEHRQGAQANNASGIRGVRLRQEGNWQRWEARVRHFSRDITVGWFDTAEEAEAAVIAKRLELFTHNALDRGESVA